MYVCWLMLVTTAAFGVLAVEKAAIAALHVRKFTYIA
jgi:hypothetical protein